MSSSSSTAKIPRTEVNRRMSALVGSSLVHEPRIDTQQSADKEEILIDKISQLREEFDDDEDQSMSNANQHPSLLRHSSIKATVRSKNSYESNSTFTDFLFRRSRKSFENNDSSVVEDRVDNDDESGRIEKTTPGASVQYTVRSVRNVSIYRIYQLLYFTETSSSHNLCFVDDSSG